MIYYTLKERDGKMAKKLMERHMRRVAEAVGDRVSKCQISFVTCLIKIIGRNVGQV